MAHHSQRRHGRPTRTLSQQGLVHIPKNPHQRGGAVRSNTLDRYNDRQEGGYLHPTKGWRKVSVKRLRAQIIMADIRQGYRMPTGLMAAYLNGLAWDAKVPR